MVNFNYQFKTTYIMDELNCTITDLEIDALKAITYSDFYENGRESVVWDYSVYDACDIPSRSRGGVFASLSTKGIITIYEGEKKFILNEDGTKTRNKWWSNDGLNFGTMCITKSGYALLDKLQLIDENGFFTK
jgi:hypothetical protein